MARCRILLVLVLLSRSCFSVEVDYDWKCTYEICRNVMCPKLPKECNNQKKAFIIPSIEKCNCCDHCFLFQKEGEDCLKSTQDLRMPNYICAPGLTCNSKGKCEKMGREDPHFFKNYICDTTGICHCAIITETGVEPIFGTFLKTEIKENEKQCECSLVAHKAKIQSLRALPFEGAYQPTVRCLPNGQFDPLQCIEDLCGCIEKDTGIPDENGFVYNVIAIGREHPHCFDPARHRSGDYYEECEKKRNKLMKEINEKYWENVNLIHFQKIDCKPDGSYNNRNN